MTTKINYFDNCVFCGNTHSFLLDMEDVIKYKMGALAQEAFPSPKYSIEDREFFISGICPKCQKSIFETEEEEEEEEEDELVNLKASILDEMNRYILNLGDEDIYEIWFEQGVPDGADEGMLMSLAEDDSIFRSICGLFGWLIKDRR